MTYHEGIVVSWDDFLNAAAMGGDLEGKSITLRVYRPCDTAENLSVGSRFTFSLSCSHELFYKAALTGHNRTGYSELDKDELQKSEGYFFPKHATKTYFCEVIDQEETHEKDEYGEARIKRIRGEILEERGEEKGLSREDPLLNAMVHATRLPLADERQKRLLTKKIESLLEKSTENEDMKELIRDELR